MSDTDTGYNLFATRDYMRCVCDTWGQEVDDCLVAVPDPSADENSGASPTSIFVACYAIFLSLSQF